MPKRKQNKFYNFSFNDSKNETELYLYGEIVSSADWKWEEEDVCFQDFKDVIDNMEDSRTLNIHVNSPGGSVFASSAIVSLLKSTKARGVTINSYIDSLGASCASWIPLVADNIYIYKNSILMVHRPMTSCFGANVDEMEKQIELLNKIEDSVMLPLYMEKAKDGITEEYIKDLLKNETWLTYDQILDIFNVTLIDEEHQDYVACVDRDVMKNYINIPDDIKDLLEKEGNNLNEDIKNKEELENEEVENEEVEETTEANEESVEEQVEEQDGQEEQEPTEEEEEQDGQEEQDVEEEEEEDVEEEEEDVEEEEPSEEDPIEQDVEEEEENLQKKLNVANEKVITLNDKVQELENKVKELEVIANKYNAIQEEKAKKELANKIEEKANFYKNKFEKVGALDKFESDEVQNLIKDCVSNNESLSKLNEMLVDMITIESNEKIVNVNVSEAGKNVENLIPTEETGLSSLFE